MIHQVLSAVILTLFRGALTRAVPQRRVERAGRPDLDPPCAGGGLEGRRTQSLVLVSERQGEPLTLYNKTHTLMIQTHAFITIIHPRQFSTHIATFSWSPQCLVVASGREAVQAVALRGLFRPCQPPGQAREEAVSCPGLGGVCEEASAST